MERSRPLRHPSGATSPFRGGFKTNPFVPSEVEGCATPAACLDFARHERGWLNPKSRPATSPANKNIYSIFLHDMQLISGKGRGLSLNYGLGRFGHLIADLFPLLAAYALTVSEGEQRWAGDFGIQSA